MSGWDSAYLSSFPNVLFNTLPYRIDLFYIPVFLFTPELLELPFLGRVVLI